MIARTSIIIESSIDEVFAYISNVENMPRWVSGVTRARLTSDGMRQGARFSADYTQGLRPAAIAFKVVEFEPPVRFSTKAERGPFAFPFRATLELRRLNGSTEVTNRVDSGPESIGSRLANLLFGPILRRTIRRRLHQELEALRAGITRGSATAVS